MGLLNKIEDKLSGNKSSSTNDSQYTDNSGYNDSSNTSSTGSRLQHPISGSTGRPTGTAVDNPPHSTTHGPTTTYGPTTTSTNTNTTHGTSSSVNRDGYGQQTSGNYPTSNTDRGYGNTGGSSVPGSYPSSNDRSYGNTTGSTGEKPSVMDKLNPMKDTSSNNNSSYPSHNATSSSDRQSSERQYYDPYSRKGQQTAASAAQSHGMGASTDQQRYPHEDANVARTSQGGVLNQQSGPLDSNKHGGQSYGAYQEPGSIHTGSHVNESSPSSGHNYGRDAGIAGGVGAGGVGAYELGKHSQQQPGSQSQNYSRPQERNPPHIQRSSGDMPIRENAQNSSMGGATGPLSGGSHQMSSGATGGAVAGESAGLSQAKKMGGAYEAGYKDGMEHMKAEMEKMSMQRGTGM